MQIRLGGLFRQQQERVQHSGRAHEERPHGDGLLSPPAVQLTHYQSLQPTSMLFDVSLKGGKVQADMTLAGRDIAHLLNQRDTHYVEDGLSAARANTLRMKDERQYLFHIQSTPAVAAVFKSSLPDALEGKGDGMSLDSPGRSHLGSVSGVQTNIEGQQFRLNNARLYRFEPIINSWLPDDDTRPYSRIGLTSEGQLLKTPWGAVDSSIDGRMAVQLSKTQAESVLHIQGAEGQAVHPVDETCGPLQLRRVGLTGSFLYGATEDGELVGADLRLARDGVLPMVRQPVESLEQALKGAISVEGFFHDDTGQLNALVRDVRQQLHSSPLSHTTSLRPQWNLSDVLVKGIEKGLPLPSQQALATAIDLGPRGTVALDVGKLLAWDAAAQRWESAELPNVEHLERGLDGRAYVLQEGQLRVVAIHKVRDPVIKGASHELSALPNPRPQVTLGEVVAGGGKNPITGFAVADGRNFVTVDKDNHLQAHQEGVVRQLSFSPPIAIKALALDHEGNLYAQSQVGELFRSDRQDWQRGAGATHRWSKMELPDHQPLDSLRMGADKHLIGGWGKQFYRLNTATPNAMAWGPVQSPVPTPSLADKLAAAQMHAQFPGGALTASSQVMGQTREGIPRTRDFLQGIKAHFHPWESLVQKGKGIQHHFTGRKALEGVYAEDKQLHEHLKPLSQSKPVSADLSTRLAALSERGPKQALAGQISQALSQVEASSHSSACRLGEVHGVRLDTRPTLSRTVVNPDSTLHQLYEAFKRLSPSLEKPAAALLANYEGQGLMLPTWNPERKRNLDDHSAIIEGDLIHHASTLKQLTNLAKELDSVSGYSPSALSRIEKFLRDVMQGFEQSPLHKLSSQGIASYDQGEALYDNFKLLAKDLATPGSALHWHLSGLLGLPANASIKEAMVRQVQQLESGQTLAPSRTQGKSLGLMVTGIGPVAPVEFFLGVSKSHTNSVSISRTDKGVRFEIKMEDMQRLAGSVASGVTLGRGTGPVGPGLRVAGELTAAVAKNAESSIGFDVKEADFGKMMSILTGEEGTVFDLLALGEGHAVGKRSKLSGDINLDVLAQLRLIYNPQENISEFDSVIRAGFGGVGNLNIAHADISRSTTRTATGTEYRMVTSTQLLREGGIGANFAPINALAFGRAESDGATMAAFASPELSVMVRFDRGQSQAFSFSFKQPQPVTQSQIDDLKRSLSRYSPQFKSDLVATEWPGEAMDEQLTALQHFLANHPPVATKPDTYHAISQSLDSLITQQHLIKGGLRQLASVDASVTRVGLRDDGRHAWLDTVAPANKVAIEQWLKDDPQFAQVLDQLQNGKGTSVKIGMELKPEVLRAIELSYLAGESPEPLIKRALSDRNNLRIRSMGLSYTATQSHAMTVPSMTNIGFSSKVGLSHTHTRVNVDLEYGVDSDQPLRMNLNDTLGSLPRHDLSIDLEDLRVRTLSPPK